MRMFGDISQKQLATTPKMFYAPLEQAVQACAESLDSGAESNSPAMISMEFLGGLMKSPEEKLAEFKKKNKEELAKIIARNLKRIEAGISVWNERRDKYLHNQSLFQSAVKGKKFDSKAAAELKLADALDAAAVLGGMSDAIAIMKDHLMKIVDRGAASTFAEERNIDAHVRTINMHFKFYITGLLDKDDWIPTIYPTIFTKAGDPLWHDGKSLTDLGYNEAWVKQFLAKSKEFFTAGDTFCRAIKQHVGVLEKHASKIIDSSPNASGESQDTIHICMNHIMKVLQLAETFVGGYANSYVRNADTNFMHLSKCYK